MNDTSADQEKPGQPPPEDFLAGFDLTPAWARQAPAARSMDVRGGDDEGRPSRRRGREERDWGDRDVKRRSPRPFRRDRNEAGGPDQRPPIRTASSAGGESAAPGRPPAAPWRNRDEAPRAFHRAERGPAAPRLPIEISFLPERLHLGAIVRRIHQARRSYPLAEVAALFLKQPDACAVKLEWNKRDGAPADARFFQCKMCRALFLQQAAAAEHVMSTHGKDLFAEETVSVEPPTGNFICVARCPKSGKILGPPNHHSFNEAVAAWHQEYAPGLSLDEYRASLETVHDPALIEQWKQEFTQRKQYRRKDQPDAEPVGALNLRAQMAALAPSMLTEPARAVVPATVARATEDPALQRHIRESWTRESRFPMTLMFALRPALRHMGLHLFKAGGNVSFVTAVAPHPLNPDHAIPAIRRVMEFLGEHPGLTGEQLLEQLCPGEAKDSPAAREVMSHLHWLTDKGHVVEFFNGTLSVARSHRSAGQRASHGADEVADVHIEAPVMPPQPAEGPEAAAEPSLAAPEAAAPPAAPAADATPGEPLPAP